jgi:hypothetical protein
MHEVAADDAWTLRDLLPRRVDRASPRAAGAMTGSRRGATYHLSGARRTTGA